MHHVFINGYIVIAFGVACIATGVAIGVVTLWPRKSTKLEG